MRWCRACGSWTKTGARFNWAGKVLSTLRHLRTKSWTAGVHDGWGLGTPIAINAFARAIVPGGGDKRISNGSAVRWVPVYSVDMANNTVQESIARLHVLNASHRITQSAPRRAIVRDQPFTDKSLMATSPDGSLAVVVTQAEEQERRRDSIVVMSVRAKRALEWSTPLHLPRPSAGSALRQLADRQLVTLNDLARMSGDRPIPRAMFFEHLFLPRSFVPAVHALVDDSGTVLLRGNDWAGGRVTYYWYLDNGATRHAFTVPVTFHIRAIRGNRIVALEENDDGELAMVTAVLKP